MGKRIVDLVPSGDVALFIATPGSAEHPAADRRRATGDQEVGQAAIKPHVIATGAALPAELSAIDAYCARPPGHEGHTSPSTPAAPRASRRRSRSTTCAPRASRAAATTSPRTRRSCWPTTRSTSRSTSSRTCRASCRSCSCTCTRPRDRCPGIADVNTGLKFLDKTTVAPYNDTKTRYEGTSTSAGRDQRVGVASGRMSDVRTETAAPTRARAGPPQPSRGAPGAPARRHARRFLTLREGSIIVVTVARGDLLRRAPPTASSRRRTSRRCCRTSPRSRSWRRARCC